MATFDLFSRRQKKLRGEVNDVYSYDSIPLALRVQIIHILRDSLGDEQAFNLNINVQEAYKTIFNLLCREYGGFELVGQYLAPNYIQQVFQFIQKEEDAEKVIDAIEVAFIAVDRFTRTYNYLTVSNFDKIATGSIEELNYRFQEQAVGFQFEDGEIIRVDSVFIHKEVVIPTLKLLNDPMYQGSQDEFLKAHQHYRRGNNKEALNECLKSFESTASCKFIE